MEKISTVGPAGWVALTFPRAAVGRRTIPPLT
jgi:hypothetical protein